MNSKGSVISPAFFSFTYRQREVGEGKESVRRKDVIGGMWVEEGAKSERGRGIDWTNDSDWN